jgi:maleamate amidohydrolase
MGCWLVATRRRPWQKEVEARMSDLQDNYKGVFDGRVGFGKKAAVLVIDFVKAYTTEGEKLFGSDIVTAVQETVDLLTAAREKNVPVIYTRVLYNENGLDGGVFVQKVPILRTFLASNPMTEIVDELPPAETDTILIKQYASCFFGTSLAPMLTAQGVDTVILTGTSTSGCVRATAIDGCQYGFRVIVPRECVGDRHEAPHESNLFDINGKYGDVVTKAETMDYLNGL